MLAMVLPGWGLPLLLSVSMGAYAGIELGDLPELQSPCEGQLATPHPPTRVYSLQSRALQMSQSVPDFERLGFELRSLYSFRKPTDDLGTSQIVGADVVIEKIADFQNIF